MFESAPVVAQAEPAVPPSRRQLMRGASWSVPVIAAGAAAPAMAASRQVDLSATITMTTTTYTGCTDSTTPLKSFRPGNTITYVATYTNNSGVTMPAGVEIRLGYYQAYTARNNAHIANGTYTFKTGFTFTSSPALVQTGVQNILYDNGGAGYAMTKGGGTSTWNYRWEILATTAPLAPGASITVTYTLTFASQPVLSGTTRYTWFGGQATTTIGVGTNTTYTEVNLANNTAYSDINAENLTWGTSVSTSCL